MSELLLGLLVNFGHHPKVEWERIVRQSSRSVSSSSCISCVSWLFPQRVLGVRWVRSSRGGWPSGPDPLSK